MSFLFKTMSFLVFCFTLGCNQPWKQPELPSSQIDGSAIIHLPASSHLHILTIDGNIVKIHSKYNYFTKYIMSSGRHTIGFEYSKISHTIERSEPLRNETQSSAVFEISFKLDSNEEYEAFSIITGNSWVPALKNLKSGQIVSKPSSIIY